MDPSADGFHLLPLWRIAGRQYHRVHRLPQAEGDRSRLFRPPGVKTRELQVEASVAEEWAVTRRGRACAAVVLSVAAVVLPSHPASAAVTSVSFAGYTWMVKASGGSP